MQKSSGSMAQVLTASKLTGVNRMIGTLSTGLLVGMLGLSACATSGSSPSAAKTEATTTSQPAVAASAQLGDPIPADVAVIPVSTVVQSVEAYDGKTVAIEGVVTKMCKKKGCWFEIADAAGGPGVLVTAPKYHIFLSQGSEGKKIVAYGQFKKEVQDLEEAKHLAKDAGEPEPTVAPVKLRILAEGARFN